ncbi:MAG: hypothetical protein M1444_04190 [Patescibacteria group bacterium]|nr:hypothetical protein [Patescibacteria group bacterium]
MAIPEILKRKPRRSEALTFRPTTAGTDYYERVGRRRNFFARAAAANSHLTS